ncbi:hypothetical protein ACQ4PT_028773 [Festuca glaucescens]
MHAAYNVVSMALMAGYYYGPAELVAGPGCSRLVQANPFFFKEITVRMAEGQWPGANGLVLYGLADGPPRLDVPAAWSEARRVVVPANSHQVTLDVRLSALLYDTTGADYACSPGNSGCTYRLPIMGQNVAVLSSSLKELSIRAFAGTHLAILAVALLLLYEVLSTMLGFCCYCCTGGEGGRRSPGAGEQRTTASLLAADKEEEASLGSSYDSVSHDGDHDEEVGGDEEERRLCVVCCDARRDCFFLPCGHSATCHPCGTRYLQCVFAEQDCMVERSKMVSWCLLWRRIVQGDGGSCPFCRRKLKKVRRIFTV